MPGARLVIDSSCLSGHIGVETVRWNREWLDRGEACREAGQVHVAPLGGLLQQRQAIETAKDRREIRIAAHRSGVVKAGANRPFQHAQRAVDIAGAPIGACDVVVPPGTAGNHLLHLGEGRDRFGGLPRVEQGESRIAQSEVTGPGLQVVECGWRQLPGPEAGRESGRRLPLTT